MCPRGGRTDGGRLLSTRSIACPGRPPPRQPGGATSEAAPRTVRGPAGAARTGRPVWIGRHGRLPGSAPRRRAGWRRPCSGHGALREQPIGRERAPSDAVSSDGFRCRPPRQAMTSSAGAARGQMGSRHPAALSRARFRQNPKSVGLLMRSFKTFGSSSEPENILKSCAN